MTNHELSVLKIQVNHILHAVTWNSKFDLEKIKLLPKADKRKVVTYLLHTRQKIIKEFVTEADINRVRKAGYRFETSNGRLTFYCQRQHLEGLSNEITR